MAKAKLKLDKTALTGPVQLRLRKLVKIGNSYGFIVPKEYIDHGLINPKQIYKVDVTSGAPTRTTDTRVLAA